MMGPMQETSGAVVAFEHVTKRYGGPDASPAVTDLSLTIPAGEVCVLVGPSGCGKTTTMKMVNRLIEPTGGRITIDGEDIMSLPAVELRRRIGYVIQQIGLFPHLTIGDNVAVVPKLLRWKASRARDRVDELLNLVGLEPAAYRDRYPNELSGGERQRVGVARALAADPPVMLMDEPFGAVDPIRRDRLQNEFLRLQQQVRKTIIFVTHDVDEAIKMGDRIAILQRGGILAQYDTPAAILANPASEFVERFVGRRSRPQAPVACPRAGPRDVGTGHRPCRGGSSGGATPAGERGRDRRTPCWSTTRTGRWAGSTRPTWPGPDRSIPALRRRAPRPSSRRRPCATRSRRSWGRASSSESWWMTVSGCVGLVSVDAMSISARPSSSAWWSTSMIASWDSSASSHQRGSARARPERGSDVTRTSPSSAGTG